MRKILPILISLILPVFVLAQIENPLTSENLEDLINGIINFIFNISLVLAPMMIIVGAFYLVTAAGNPNQVETGKKVILYALIGFLVILLAKGLATLIISILRGK